MAALLTSERANTDKMVQYIGECREMGIEVLPPDVNESEMFFRPRPAGGSGAALRPPGRSRRHFRDPLRSVRPQERRRGRRRGRAPGPARDGPLHVPFRPLRPRGPPRRQPARDRELRQERQLRLPGLAPRGALRGDRPGDGGRPEAPARPRVGAGEPVRRGRGVRGGRSPSGSRRLRRGPRPSGSRSRRSRWASSSPATRSSASAPSSRSGRAPRPARSRSRRRTAR